MSRFKARGDRIAGAGPEGRNFTLRASKVTIEKNAPDAAIPPELQRKKVAFLIFDTALTGLKYIEKSKNMAADIVTGAEPSFYFSVLTIDPIAGLIPVLGPTSDKTVVLQAIRARVTASNQSKPFSWADISYLVGAITSTDGLGAGKDKAKSKGDRLDEVDIDYMINQFSRVERKKTSVFLESFKTLQQVLAGIQDNRVLFLFTEGLSNFTASRIYSSGTLPREGTGLSPRASQGQDAVAQFMSETAASLNRCGGVLFVVNPAGVEKASNSNSSGEDSLRQLANLSGGKYLEGQDKKIVETIGQSQRAYYEIAFPAPLDADDTSVSVAITSRRPGIQVFSLKSAFRKKRIDEMSPVEQGMFVLECLAGNPLLKKAYDILVVSAERREQTIEGEKITMHLPFDPRGKKLILYQVGFSKENEPLSLTIHPVSSESPHLLLDLKKKKSDDIAYWRQVVLNIDTNVVLINPLKIEAL